MRLSAAQHQQQGRLGFVAPPASRAAGINIPLLSRPPLPPSRGGSLPLFSSVRPRTSRGVPAQVASRRNDLWTASNGDDEGEGERATSTTTPRPSPPSQRSVSPSSSSTATLQAHPRAGKRWIRFYGGENDSLLFDIKLKTSSFFTLPTSNLSSSSCAAAALLPPPRLLFFFLCSFFFVSRQ